jgi:hypothetical protein
MSREVVELGNHANSTVIEAGNKLDTLDEERQAFFG